MARRPKKSHDKKTAPLKVFVLIGKPFYFVLSRIFIVFLFLFYLAKVGAKNTVLMCINLWQKLRLTLKTKSKVSPKPKNKTHLLRLDFLRVELFIERFRLKFRNLFRPLKINRALIFTGLTIIFISLLYLFIFKDLPSPLDLTNRNIDISTKIYDRNGQLLYKIYKDKNRTLINLDQIPTHVILATLAAEDAEFYNHNGFSLKGIFRAITQNITRGTVQGGSTITQQLVKNALLSPQKTISRKIKEIILSIEVELNYTKDQILEMYLNEVSYGGTAYGIEEASYSYFGKKAKELNLAEAALIAGLPKSPTTYSPFGENSHLAIERQKEVLKLMRINKYITQEQEQEALKFKLQFISNKTEIKAPHFVMYVRQQLVNKYGEDVVEHGGLEVTTTLDLKIQEMAESIVKNEIDKLKNLNVGNGAALVVNPKTGEILAMVGGHNYFDIKSEGNVNVTTRERQPGSSIKVINYAYAFGHGYSPSTVIDDSPITFATPGSPAYSPKNYDGKFKGKITLRQALAESRNIPAVKLLATYGVGKMIELGQSMGISTWDAKNRFGLSLTLGGGETKLTELAGVFATIANNGSLPEVSAITKITDHKGTIVEENDHTRSRAVLDSRIAYMLIDILKDNNARSGEFGLNSYLVIKNHPEVAVKTGTSNDLKDNLAIGFNQNYLTAVWVGNNDNKPMSKIASGITGASPIWNKIMTALLENQPSIEWETPTGIIRKNCFGKSEIFLSEDKNNIAKYCTSPVEKPLDIKDNKESKRVPQIM